MSNCQDKHQTTATNFCPDCGEKMIKDKPVDIVIIQDEPKELMEEVAKQLTEIAFKTVRYLEEHSSDETYTYSKKYLCKFFEFLLERRINIPKNTIFMLQNNLYKIIPITQLYNICPNLRRLQLKELFSEDNKITSWLYLYDESNFDAYKKINNDIKIYDEQSIPKDISHKARVELYDRYVYLYNTELEEKNAKRQKVC